MKKLLFFIGIFYALEALEATAQDYLISFAGTGASTSVNYVKVENITTGTSLILSGSDILHLTSIITEVKSIKDNQLFKINIHPNPMDGYSTLSIYPPVAGDAIITITDMTGKQVAQIQSFLENSLQEFNLSGTGSGFYLISVKGNTYQYSGKLLCNGDAYGQFSFQKKISNNKTTVEQRSMTDLKGTQAEVEMVYENGNLLKFTGISGNYRTIKTDIPSMSKTITFNFLDCVDGDFNNYPVVEIGTQVWMAENLKTTKYNDGNLIPTFTDNTIWMRLTTPAFSWYNFDEASYKETYGALYNWYSASTGNLCPSGWHLPTDTEWKTLSTYLGGTSVAGGKLKEPGTSHWQSDDNGASNMFGFTALPAGERFYFGAFSGINTEESWWSLALDQTGDAWCRSVNSMSGSLDSALKKVAFGYSVRCLYGPIRKVITTGVSLTTQSTAMSGGNVISDGEENVTSRGVCWSTSSNPSIADNKTIEGAGTGIFTSLITGLSTNTRYYLKAYATYNSDIEYGSEISFPTKGETGTISDIDGNTYTTIQIGPQVWMAENLKTSHFKDGTAIALVTDDNSWKSLTTPGYCWYGNSEVTNKVPFGALYNWYAVNTGSLCPTGWHVPTREEWMTLISYCGGAVAGLKLKETGDTYWHSDPWGYNEATNESGFSARAGGHRLTAMPIDPNYCHYEDLDSWGYWWTTSEYSASDAYYIYNYSRDRDFNTTNTLNKKSGNSIRCVKD